LIIRTTKIERMESIYKILAAECTRNKLMKNKIKPHYLIFDFTRTFGLIINNNKKKLIYHLFLG